MHDHHLIVEKRLERFLFERIRPACYGATEQLDVTAWAPEGEPLPIEAARQALHEGRFTPFAVGAPYGTPWSTTWFHCTARVPSSWSGQAVHARIDLGFGRNPGFQAEGLVWGPQGPRRALNPLNHAIPVLGAATGGEAFEFLVEAAANPQIGERRYEPSPMGDPATLPRTFQYALKRAELAIMHPQVVELVHDLDVLGGLLRELPLNAPRRPQITRAIERALDALDLHHVVDTADAARAQLSEVLSRPAVPSAHRISAVGHAHIDTAWLWPIRETVRKCARTFSNVLDLMNTEPELLFVCSQAQQHDWMREHYPSVFAGMVQRAAEGRFLPVGGMWVEADMNLPSGESLARQLLHGQRFFAEHYGRTCEEIWIPDVFGYPASLPQIFALGGAKFFLTQKLSWNKQNRMPHHTMWWEGIDGSRIFTHFPPVDTYNVEMQPAQLAHAERNYADHGGGTMSLAPFGYGNGGGGPTREMMARYRRMRDLEGLPRVTIESPAAFFRAAEADYPDAPTWTGELYFETHRGTYTSQAKTKLGNRRCEELLGDVELWSTIAARRGLQPYPYARLQALWQEVLTLQFHDIIPGSSIAWVYDDAEAAYARIQVELVAMRDAALRALSGGAGEQMAIANPIPYPSSAVVCLPADCAPAGAQLLHDGRAALPIAPLAPCSLATIATFDGRASEVAGATIRATETGWELGNDLITVSIDAWGRVVSLCDLRVDREIIPAGQVANTFELSADHPVEYDAWDLDEYHAQRIITVNQAGRRTIVDAGPHLVALRMEHLFGTSIIVQTITLAAGSARLDFVTEVEWHENEKLLKVAMPLDVHANEVTCDIQYGHVRRPTHASTSWDAAKFEICAHRWVDLSEPQFGVALLNDCKYGYDAQRNALRLTLLKASNYPDPDADRGSHRFTYALLPHAGGLEEVRTEAARLNQPVVPVRGVAAAPAITAVASLNANVVITALKYAEDASGDVIMRCFEASGGRQASTITTDFDAAAVVVCDLLEEPLTGLQGCATLAGSNRVDVALRPFQILTLRLVHQ